MQTAARYHVFLWVGVATYLLLLLGNSLGLQYDDSGIRGAGFWILYFVGFFYRLAYRIVFSLSGGNLPWIRAWSALLGFAAYVCADGVVIFLARHQREGGRV
jgi:hypothetical protein